SRKVVGDRKREAKSDQPVEPTGRTGDAKNRKNQKRSQQDETQILQGTEHPAARKAPSRRRSRGGHLLSEKLQKISVRTWNFVNGDVLRNIQFQTLHVVVSLHARIDCRAESSARQPLNSTL